MLERRLNSPRVDGRGEMVIELPLRIGEAGSLAPSTSAATDSVAGSAASQREVVVPHSGGEAWLPDGKFCSVA